MPVPHMFLFAQLRQGAIDLLARDRATLDINQTMRIAPKKTDHAVLRVHGDAVAICVLPRRRDYRTHGNILQFADSLERVAQLSPFNRELMFVIDMLIRAAAASTEIRALWRDAIRRTLLNFNQLCFGELLFFPDDFGGNQFRPQLCKEQKRLCPVPEQRLFRRTRRPQFSDQQCAFD